MVEKDITKLSIQELEALGYRTLRELELQKRNIATIEAMILEKQEAAAKVPGPKEIPEIEVV